MGCGNTLSVFQEDPQDMPGQGLARTDNYRSVIADMEYRDLLRSYTNNENQTAVLDAEKRYKPQYISMDAANTGQALGENLDLLNQYMPEIGALRDASDPEAAALRRLLLSQATSDVQAGGSLTPEQQRAAVQSSRAAMAARGLSGGNQAVADEMAKQFDLSEAVKNSRRGFAMNLLNLNQQLGQGFTARDWLQLAQGTARSAGPTLTPLEAQVNWLSSVYAQNQANNRAQAGLETQIGQQQAEIWNDWGKTATGASIGGGAGGAMGGSASGGSKQYLSGNGSKSASWSGFNGTGMMAGGGGGMGGGGGWF